MEKTTGSGLSREDRLAEWIEIYSDAILRVCYLYLGDRAQAEDALQDTWVKAWQHMKKLEKQPVLNDRAWLMRIAVNTCKDYRRTAWFRHVDRSRGLDELPPRYIQQEEKDRSLSIAVRSMPDRCKRVILLYYYQGLTLRETGEALNMTVSSVNRLLRKAERMLKDEWTGGNRNE